MPFFNLARWLRSLSRPHTKPIRNKHNSRMNLEVLEDRTLLATAVTALPISNLPIPLANNQTSLGSTLPGLGAAGQEAGGMNPQVAVDPMNPLKVVVVATNGDALVGYYSIDGGQAWTNFMNKASGDFTNAKQKGYLNAYPNLDDPNLNVPDNKNAYPTNPTPYALVSSASVAFDRTESFYILDIQSSADGSTNGALVLNKFNFSGTNVPLVPPTSLLGLPSGTVISKPTIANEVLYTWLNDNGKDGDPIYNATIGIDNNVPSYTDPQTGVTQTDTLADLVPDPSHNSTVTPYGLSPLIVNPSGLVPKGVYIAWNTNYSSPPKGVSANAIRTVVSPDGGIDWTNPTTVAAVDAASPQIVFTQGSGKSVAAGFDYEGTLAPPLNLSPATTTAQVFANLNAIPALTGNVTVTGTTGGPFLVTFSPTTFNFGLFTNNPNLATSATFIVYSSVTNTVTINPPVTPGGQVVFEWNALPTKATSGGIDLALSQPTAGVDSNAAAAADTYTFTGAPGNIATPSGTAPFTPVATPFTFTVTNANLNANIALLDTLTVDLSIIAPDVSAFTVSLSSPNNVKTATLFASGVDPTTGTAFTKTPANALKSPTVNMGVMNVSSDQLNGYSLLGNPTGLTPPGIATVFDDTAERPITDGSAATPFIGDFRPAGGVSLNTVFAGLTRLQMIGTWTLTITANAPPATGGSGTTTPNLELVGAAINITGQTAGNFKPAAVSPFGLPLLLPIQAQTKPTSSYELVNGSPNGNYGFGSSVSPGGVGPGISIAVDNTLGSFSPYQGQFYVAYTGIGIYNGLNSVKDDTDIFLLTSSDDGQTWNGAPASSTSALSIATPTRINNDLPTDGFSEGDRAQFNPALAVDSSTGNLVVTYYDGRYDPSRVRLIDSLTVSNDGGKTFTPAIALNTPANTTDAITGQTVVTEPIPGNPGLAGNLVEPNGGFGDRQGLAVVNGHVFPIFTSNLNSLDVANGNPAPQPGTNIAANIWTATVTIPTGPRIISSDMGPILQDGSTGSYNSTQTAGIYNNTFTADGTRQLTGFTVTFDRAVDPSTFTPGQVTLKYQSPTSLTGTFQDLSSQITSVVPLNMEDAPGLARTPTLSVGDGILARGVQGVVMNMLFPIILSQPQLTSEIVQFSTADGTAIDGSAAHAGIDFQANTASVIVTAAAGTVTFSYNGVAATPLVFDSATTTAGDLQAILSTIPALAGNVTVSGQGGDFNITLVNNLQAALLTVGTTDPVVNPLPLSYTGFVVIPAGQTSANIAVPIIGSSAAHKDQSFTVNVGAPFAVTVNRFTATGQIVNPTVAPSVSIGDAILNKGFYGSVNAVIPVILSAPALGGEIVQYATADGTATTAANQYTGESTSLTFAAGQTIAYISVPVIGNSSVTGDLTFSVVLSQPTGLTLAKTTGKVTIVDQSGLLGATQFQINIMPQSAVGSYSYAISPFVRDRIRSVSPTITNPFTGNPAILDPNPARGAVVVTASAPPSQVNLSIPSIYSNTFGTTNSSSLVLGGVPLGQLVRKMTVTVTLDHPVPQDIVMTLIGPNGTSIELTAITTSPTLGTTFLYASPNGLGNYLQTTFASTAAQSITTGNAPFSGVYRPVQSLNAFIGADPNTSGTSSTWTLLISNQDPGDPFTTPARAPTAATLVSWSITVQTATPVDLNTSVVSFTAPSGSTTLTYNGKTGTPAAFAFSPATTAAQFQKYLTSLPGLTSAGAVTVAAASSSVLNQYASSVIGFSSQYSTTLWSGLQATGAPNTAGYGDLATAWAPLPENGSQEFLTVGFKTPVFATGVDIRETDGNGFVTQVDLLDTNGVYHTVFTGPDTTPPNAPGDLILSFPATAYQVKGVKIYVNTNTNLTTWEEIDAVQLQGSTGNGGVTTGGPFFLTFAPGLDPNSLTVVSGAAQISPPGSSSGNFSDQIGNGIAGDLIDPGDTYSIPAPVNGIPFKLPYNQATLPLIIPGPHAVDMTYSATPVVLAFTDVSGTLNLAYNGVSAGLFNYTATSTTPAMVQTYLKTIPALAALGNVTVTGGLGGSFTISLAGGLDPTQLSVISGPVSLTMPGADNLSFNATSGKVTLAYNGAASSVPLPFDLATTTAAAVQAYLATLPGLGGPGNTAVSGGLGGPFTITFGGGARAALLTVASGPALMSVNPGQVSLAIPDAVRLNTGNEVDFTANSGSIVFTYNTASGAAFPFVVGTTTASQLQANLSGISGLSAPGSVTVAPGASGSFIVSFANGLNPDLLTVKSGPASLNNLSAASAGLLNSTIAVAGVAPGQVISKLKVTVQLSHSLLSDLQLVLVAPDGTRVPLATNTLTSGIATFSDTGLSATSATVVGIGTILGTGPDIAPAAPLSAPYR